MAWPSDFYVVSELTTALAGRGHWLVQGLTPPVIGTHTEVNTPRPCTSPEALAVSRRVEHAMPGILAVDRLEVLVLVDNLTDSLSTNSSVATSEWTGLSTTGRMSVL